MPSENAVCPILHLLCADTCNRLKQPYIVRHIFNAATDPAAPLALSDLMSHDVLQILLKIGGQ
ncbi:hypothetical protein [Neisseria viridiae]|uniref:hypothetical protein n=1 Tax=Neisseria viridiae TaxID=2830648 RepID=UPI00272B2622|nr:hypothetical protein [Neisseria viridiae]